MQISLVVLTQNEELSIGDVLDGAAPHVDEILVVDGHSTDRKVLNFFRVRGGTLLGNTGRPPRSRTVM